MTSVSLSKNNIIKKGSKNLYGLFFEDINHAADGGINAELLSNNSFEFEYINYNDRGEKVEIRYDKLKYWSFFGDGSFKACKENGMNENNPTFLRAKVLKNAALSNCGYPEGEEKFGIALNKGDYDFSFFARSEDFDGRIKVFLESENGRVSNEAVIVLKNGSGFEKYDGVLTVLKKADAVFKIELEGSGTLDLDYFSLISQDGLVGDKNVWRYGRVKKQFFEVLNDLNPRFVRFPGGCIVEGDADFSNMYMWKNTVGKLHERRQNANTWQYMQSYAIGFYEYFLLCEELNAEPLPVVPLGLLCQIRSGQRHEGDISYKVGTDEFDKNVVDNAAHLIYFALGDINSLDENERYWARIRLECGHEKPFNMKLLGLGNENWGKIYFKNLSYTLRCLKSYPYNNTNVNLLEKFAITIVGSCGVDIRPQDTNASTLIINKDYPNFIVDEHCYNTMQWFVDNFHRYDYYDRTLAKVFMGEYGMHTKSDGRGKLNGVSNLKAALSEAVFLTGCERNNDVVAMTAYAPLFAKTEGYKWTPDLIWFNNRDIMRTPSYFVQQMFASNYGTSVVKTPKKDEHDIKGGVFLGTFDAEVVIKSVSISLNGKAIFRHDFKNGLGNFKLYPNSLGGTITEKGLVIKGEKALNGYYLDEDFGDCDYEFEAEKLSGNEGFIFGIGLKGVKKTDFLDFDEHSLWLNYGALDGKVAFEKRYDYMRVAFEIYDDLSADFGYNRFTLSLNKGKLTALRHNKQASEILFSKNVYRTHEKLFLSATTDESSYYLKAVNIKNNEEELCITSDLGTVATITTLAGNIDDVNEIDLKEGVKENLVPSVKKVALKDGKLTLIIPPYSVNVIKIN